MSEPSPAVPPQVFRLPAPAYLIVLFLLFCTVPLAVAGDASHLSQPELSPRIVLLLIPVAGALYIARTRTRVDERGIAVRALLGTRSLPWDEVRGLSVSGRSVYAVQADGSVRLPCVRVADLAAVSRASAGRLPQLADPTPKYAPARRPRRAARRG